jgi:hypothetical protein
MLPADSTGTLGRFVVTIAAAVIFTALVVTIAMPALAQGPPCTPGTIVDFCSDIPPGHGFVREKKGVFTTIDVPGASLTVVWDINNRGQMVGPYVDAQGPTSGGFTHGFLLDDGVFTTIDFPGPSETELAGSNNRGEIAGVYRDAAGITHGALLDKGTFTTIDVEIPGAVGT